MNNSGAKPKRDPTTGRGHIVNWWHPAYGYRRCCSYCYTPLRKDTAEEWITNCQQCGIEFDHNDDDPMDPEDAYD